MDKDDAKVVRGARTREGYVRRQATKNPAHWTPEYRAWIARQMLKEQKRQEESS